MKRLFTLLFFIVLSYSGFSQTLTWLQLNNITAGAERNRAGGFAINGKGYVIAGGNSWYLPSAWCYDTLSGSWSQIQDYPSNQDDGVVGFTINGYGYAGTGAYCCYQFSNSLYRYDPGANQWTTMASIPGPTRGFAVAFVINGKAYVGGGLNSSNNNPLNDFYQYDPAVGATGTWTQMANCPALGISLRAAAFAIGGKGYVGTGGKQLSAGSNQYVPQKDFWEFDPTNGATGTWTQKNDFPGLARWISFSFATSDKGYIGDGYTNQQQTTYTKDFWRYDACSDQWTQLSDYAGQAVVASTWFVMGQTAYVCCGVNSSGSVTGDLWKIYLPVVPPPTVTVNFSAPTTTCAGQQVTFTDASSFTPTSWAWSFPGGTPDTSNSQSPIVTYSTPGVYSVSYTASSTCSAGTKSAPAYITVGAPGSLSILPKSPAICSGGMVTLTATGGSGLVWSPSASLNQSSGASVVASPTITTIYNVNGAGGCTSSGFDTVIVNQPVPVSISPAATTVCAGSGVLLTATTAGTNITWSPSAGLSATAGASVTATPSSTATYTASAVGCVSPGSNVVTVTQPQQLTVYPSSSTICAGQSVPLVATASGTNIVWSPAAGLSTTNGASPTASPTISTTYTVSSTGCTSPGTVVFTVTQPVPLTVTPASPKICLGGSGTTLSATGGTGITWSPPTGLNTTNGGSVTATPLTTTVYTATASGGCTSPTTDTVIVNQPSLLTIAPASPSICAGQTVTLTVTGGTGISWNPSTGLNTATGSPVVANAPVNDSMTYIVTGTNAAGCSAAGLVTLHTGGSSIPGDVTTIRDTLCQGTPGNLALIGNSTNTIQWQSSSDDVNFTDINVTDTTRFKTEPLIKTTWYRATVGSGACIAESDTLQLFVPPALTAFFSATQTKAKQLTFDADSSSGNIQAYHWDFGDGQTSSEKDPVHTFKSDTTYYVCLTLYDGSNCSYTFCRYLDILAEGVPTVLAAGDWVIYPNPFSEQLTVSSEQGTGASKIQSIEMYDVLGRMVTNKELDNTANTSLRLDVSSLAKGMYFVIIKTADANYVQKVVKQ